MSHNGSGPAQVALARYSATIVDTLTDYVLASDLPLTRLKYTLALNDTGTADLTVDARAVAAAVGTQLTVEEATADVRRTCYLYRDNVPVFGGLVTASRYDSETEGVDLGLSDWWWALDRRVIMPDPATLPPDNIAERVVAFAGVDQCDIARELVRLAQLGTNRDLLLVATDGDSGIPRDRTYYGYELRNVGHALRQLAGVIDGCDVRMSVAHREGFATPLRTVLIGTPYLGASAVPIVWEYGANAFRYSYPRDGSEHADRAYATGDGSEVGTPIVARDRGDDLGQDLAGWPALDSVDAYSSVIDLDTLRDHADDQLHRRAGSRVVLGTAVRGDDPPVGAFELGQSARFVSGRTPFHDLDTQTRIVGLEVEVVDEVGEVAVPLLNPVKVA